MYKTSHRQTQTSPREDMRATTTGNTLVLRPLKLFDICIIVQIAQVMDMALWDLVFTLMDYDLALVHFF